MRLSREEQRAKALPLIRAAFRILRREKRTIREALDAAAGPDTLVREWARREVRACIPSGYQETHYSTRDWDSDSGTIHEERMAALRKAMLRCGFKRGYGGGWKVTPGSKKTRRAA